MQDGMALEMSSKIKQRVLWYLQLKPNFAANHMDGTPFNMRPSVFTCNYSLTKPTSIAACNAQHLPLLLLWVHSCLAMLAALCLDCKV